MTYEIGLSSERLGRIVEEAASEVYIFSADDFRFLLVNKGARENLGYSISELSLMTPWDLKPEIDEQGKFRGHNTYFFCRQKQPPQAQNRYDVPLYMRPKKLMSANHPREKLHLGQFSSDDFQHLDALGGRGNEAWVVPFVLEQQVGTLEFVDSQHRVLLDLWHAEVLTKRDRHAVDIFDPKFQRDASVLQWHER